ncbi:MAG: DUF5678 domain-containing protein, partial [Promethearchaeota archaeon]
GKWVLLKDDQIIESDDSPRELHKKAQKYNKDEVIISKIPSSEYCFY